MKRAPFNDRYCYSCGARLARDHTAVRCSPCQTKRTAQPPEVPTEFWDADLLQDALRSRHMGRVITAYRNHPLHGRPLHQKTVAAWVMMTQPQLSRLENGPPIRDLGKLMLWARTLRIPEELLWFQLPNGESWPNSSSSSVQYDQEVSERDNSKEIGDDVGCPLLEPWELFQVLDRSALGTRALAELERTTVGYIKAYPSTPPGVLIRSVGRNLERVVNRLNEPQSLRARQRLTVVTAQLAATTGSLLFDLDLPRKANPYFDVAIAAGQDARDDDLLAWTLATQSLVPAYGGEDQQALKILARALHHAKRGASPTRLSWIAALKARVHAGLGQEAACRELLYLAEQCMDRSHEPAVRPETDFFDLIRLQGLRGKSFLLLGLTEMAESILQDVLQQRQESDVKGRSLVKLDLATVYMKANHPEEACSVIMEALDIPADTRVRPIVAQARLIRADLEHWRDSDIVRELDEFLEAIVMPDSSSVLQIPPT